MSPQMSSQTKHHEYRRAISLELEKRLAQPRKFMQIVSGPRQTGKTTAVKQAINAAKLPSVYLNGDLFVESTPTRLELEWAQARELAKREGKAVLFIDEVQKIHNWSNNVKALWDEDAWDDIPLLVVLSGSSTLLIKRGMSDSLKGRFELLHSTQWSFSEMKEAFNYSLEEFLLYGGYPGGAAIKDDFDRWLRYIKDSIVETTISSDILQLENIRKPALLKRLYELGAYYSGQEISYRKILGQLDDKGNTEVIAHYLDLLESAGMLAGLKKFDNKLLRANRSSPKFMVYDTALMAASKGDEAPLTLEDPELRGRLVESAVGAYLLNRSVQDGFNVSWWRSDSNEVDFVISKGNHVRAVEVKSGKVGGLEGLSEFLKVHPKASSIIVGEGVNTLEDFLLGKVPLF